MKWLFALAIVGLIQPLLPGIHSTVLFEGYCPGTASSWKEQKYFVVGARDSPNYGIGNLLAFFPAVYYYAMLTARFIVIEDSSYIGHMCTVLHCGFPLLSTVKVANPDLFSTLDESQMRVLRHNNFPQSFGANPTKFDDILLTATGMDARSDWWVWQDNTRKCVAMISGCLVGDVGCAERAAFQALVVGPFLDKRKISAVLPSISGMSTFMKHGILNLPRSYAPRIDITVHLRNQFVHFEQEVDPAHPDAQNEVQAWLNSTESKDIFSKLTAELTSRLISMHPTVNANATAGQGIHVYVAADNEDAKRAFKQFVLAQPKMQEMNVHVVTLETNGIFHIKNLHQLKSSSEGRGLLFLVLDWYMIALSSVVLAWRTGSTKGFSTFVGSARKVSGTRERTTLDDGRSVATRAFQLVKGKHGYQFEELWVYGVIDGRRRQ